MPKRLTNEEVQNRLNNLRHSGCDVFTDDTYKTFHDDMEFYCSKGHHWSARLSNILQGKGCPYCINKKACIGFNDLWTTNPETAQLLLDKNVGYLYTKGSEKKVSFVCPNCGAILNKVINNVRRRGLSCNVCGDGISFPNKMGRSLLKQLNVQNIQYEWQPDWLKPYFYDNYFECNGQKYVLEMDGGIGHGNREYRSNCIDVCGVERDLLKDSLSAQHNVCVIRIDCDYDDIITRFDFIKNNILNSDLSSVCNLSCVDWSRCYIEVNQSFVHTVSEMYAIGFAMDEIATATNYSVDTIRGWLKVATHIGLCDYNPSEAKSRACKTKHIVNQYDIDGYFMTTYESYKEAHRKMGIDDSSIRKCCKHIKKSAGGFLWFDADDPTQPDKSKIITQQND